MSICCEMIPNPRKTQNIDNHHNQNTWVKTNFKHASLTFWLEYIKTIIQGRIEIISRGGLFRDRTFEHLRHVTNNWTFFRHKLESGFIWQSLGWIPRNFKIFIFKTKKSFLRENHKIDVWGAYLDFSEFILCMIFKFFTKIAIFEMTIFRKKSKGYIRWIREIHPSYHFSEFNSKITILAWIKYFAISRYSA